MGEIAIFDGVRRLSLDHSICHTWDKVLHSGSYLQCCSDGLSGLPPRILYSGWRSSDTLYEGYELVVCKTSLSVIELVDGSRFRLLRYTGIFGFGNGLCTYILGRIFEQSLIPNVNEYS